MDFFYAHRRLIAMNIFAFVLVVFMVLMFTHGLKNVSQKDKEIFARFLALERKIEKSEAKLHRIETIKHEVRLLEREWQYIVKNLKLLTEKDRRVDEMGTEVNSMKHVISDLEKKLNVKSSHHEAIVKPEKITHHEKHKETPSAKKPLHYRGNRNHHSVTHDNDHIHQGKH